MKTSFEVPCFIPTEPPTLIPPVTAPPTEPPTAPPTATAPPTVPPGPTSLTIDPPCGPPQLVNDIAISTFVTASGTGFRPGTVVLTLDPGGLNQQQLPAVPVQPDGTFSAQVPIRAGPDGKFLLRAEQTINGVVVPPAEAIFSVPCVAPAAALSADIPCGVAAAGVPFAYSINLTGTGFLPGRVELTFDAGGLAPEPQLPAIAAADGSFSALITPTGRGPGMFYIAAHQQVAGSLTFVDQSVVFSVACTPASFVLMPDRARRGMVVLVSGLNFPADADLYLRWSRGIGISAPLLVHTDANGVFSRQILIFPSDFSGPRQLRVELVTDPFALAGLAPADFTVIPGTISPPFSVTDNPYAAADATIVIRR